MRLINFAFLVSVLCLVGIGVVAESLFNQPVEISDDLLKQSRFVQQLIDPQKISDWGEYKIESFARIEITALVLGRANYWYGEKANLSPIDLVLGWGPVTNDNVLSKITFRQWGRYYSWYSDNLPIAARVIATHTANVHLIPTDDQLRLRMRTIRRGDLVSIQGDLVKVRMPSGGVWISSSSREDRGTGSCELILVERLMTDPRPKQN